MKKMLYSALVATAMLAGCRSVEVENYGQDYVRNAAGDPVLVDGKPVIIGKGWAVSHWQHWMSTQADTLTAEIAPEKIGFTLNGLTSNPDSDGLAKVIEKSLTGAAELSAKIAAAFATSGGSAGADAIYGYVKQFLAKGGDPSKATVTVTDGKLTCTDGSCTVSGECSDCTP